MHFLSTFVYSPLGFFWRPAFSASNMCSRDLSLFLQDSFCKKVVFECNVVPWARFYFWKGNLQITLLGSTIYQFQCQELECRKKGQNGKKKRKKKQPHPSAKFIALMQSYLNEFFPSAICYLFIYWSEISRLPKDVAIFISFKVISITVSSMMM